MQIFGNFIAMKSTSIAVSLDTRRVRKDGTYPIILRLTHKSKTTSIKTGIYLQENDWDAEARAVKKSAKVLNVTRLNNEIQKKKAEALDNILKLEEKSKQAPLSITDIKGKIVPSTITHSFYEFSEKLIKDLRKAGRIGTARSYDGTISVLKTFNKGKALPKNMGGNPNVKIRLEHKGVKANVSDLSFEEVNYTFLKKFETYHLSSGNGLNGLAVYMRTIRAIFNQAIKEGLAERNHYPFAQYKIKTVPTRKRALDGKWLKKLIDLHLEREHPCFDYRNYFVASYMMYGMNFTDMAFLEKSNINQGRINYRRKKTSKLYDIKVTDGLNEILTYYLKLNPASKYVFPIIKREGTLMQARDIQWARQRYNEKLKDIASLCGIEENLTSYVSRHSFATQAMLNQVPLNAISSMLGHSSLKTTEIYLKGLPSNILDNYNSAIIGLG